VLAQGRGLAPVVQSVSGATTILPPADERTELSISGIYLQQNFKYNNNLFITGAIRVDGSSVFGEDQRNQVYTKLSGSYVMSGDEWFKSKFFNLLKFRAAYGESGNLTGIGAYSRFNTYLSTSYLGRTSFTSPTTLANENVKPERQKELEFGTDIAVLNNRISLSANYYIKRVKDLLINRVIAPSRGFSSLQDNFGELENKGFELVLNASPVAGKDFRWNTTFIFNRTETRPFVLARP
jgi:outer membrane receptor protein involved in Fe transport